MRKSDLENKIFRPETQNHVSKMFPEKGHDIFFALCLIAHWIYAWVRNICHKITPFFPPKAMKVNAVLHVVVQQLQIFQWEKDFLQFSFSVVAEQQPLADSEFYYFFVGFISTSALGSPAAAGVG